MVIFRQYVMRLVRFWRVGYMKKAISLFVCILFSAGLFAQKNFWKEAEKKFSTYEYFGAIDMYKAAYKTLPKAMKPEALWKTILMAPLRLVHVSIK